MCKDCPVLSIIVTTYNVEQYIEQCLKDVLNQSIKDFELIVVDDGSTDKTPEIIKAWGKKDSRIRPIILQENSPGGVATAANIGLNAARGVWVGFADGDDMFRATMFEKLLSAAETYDSDISICRFKEYDNREQQSYEPWDPYWNELSRFKSLNLSEDRIRQRFLKLNPVPWRKLYKRSFLENNQIRFEECEFFFEDNSFHWFVTLNANSVAFVDEALCYHRMNRRGQTMLAGGSRLLGVFYQFDVIKQYLEKHDKYKTFKHSLIEWLFGQTAWIAEELDPRYWDLFFTTLQEKFKNITLKDCKPVLKQGCSRKLISIVIAVFSNDSEAFKIALNNKIKHSLLHRLLIKYYQCGMKGLIKSPFVKLGRNLHHSHQTQEQLSGIHWELSEIRKLLELNAIYQETLIEKLNKVESNDR